MYKKSHIFKKLVLIFLLSFSVFNGANAGIFSNLFSSFFIKPVYGITRMLWNNKGKILFSSLILFSIVAYADAFKKSDQKKDVADNNGDLDYDDASAVEDKDIMQEEEAGVDPTSTSDAEVQDVSAFVPKKSVSKPVQGVVDARIKTKKPKTKMTFLSKAIKRVTRRKRRGKPNIAGLLNKKS